MRFVFVITLTLSVLMGQGFANDSQYFLKVTSKNAVFVYVTPQANSRKINQLKTDQLVQIIAKRSQWFQVRIPISKTGFITGWVEHEPDKVKIYKKPVSAQQPTKPTPPTLQKESPKPAVKEALKEKTSAPKPKKQDADRDQKEIMNPFLEKGQMTWRAFVAPVYNIKDYFSSSTDLQYRFGAALEKMMTDKVWLSVPVAYSTGSGFSTIMGGVHGHVSIWATDKSIVYAKFGPSYEYLFASGANFHGVNVDVGVGYDYVINDRFSVGIEPLSIQAMVFRSEDNIPMNFRGLALISVRSIW